MITRQDLIEDAQRVQSLIKGTMTKSDYVEHGEYSTGPLYDKFDGLYELREQAEIEDSHITSGQRKSKDELLDAIHDLKDELGRAPKREEMIEQGSVSEDPFRRVFGTWSAAVKEAGYEPYRPNKYNSETKIYTCEYCGEERGERISQNNNQENWFCSDSCKDEWQSENIVGENHHQYNRVSTECDWCGSPKEVIPAVFERRDNIFCNLDCAGSWWSENRVGENNPTWEGGPVKVTCEGCGGTERVKSARVEGFRFCSYSCEGDVRKVEMRGEGNPNFNPDSVDEFGPNWAEQREKCLERDGHECVDCGGTSEQHKQLYGTDLIAHHVQPRRLFVTDGELDWEAANKLSNLRTVCHECHGKWEGWPVAPQ